MAQVPMPNTNRGINRLQAQPGLNANSMIQYMNDNGLRIPIGDAIYATRKEQRYPVTNGELYVFFNNTFKSVTITAYNPNQLNNSSCSFLLMPYIYKINLSATVPSAAVCLDPTFTVTFSFVATSPSGSAQQPIYGDGPIVNIDTAGVLALDNDSYGNVQFTSINSSVAFPSSPYQLRIINRTQNIKGLVKVWKNGVPIREVPLDMFGNNLTVDLSPSLTFLGWTYYDQGREGEEFDRVMSLCPGFVVWVCQQPNEKLIFQTTKNDNLLLLPTKFGFTQALLAPYTDPNFSG